MKKPRSILVFAVAVCALSAGACAPGDDTGRYTETDSAGVRIVHTTQPLWGSSSPWRLSPEPTVDIGRVEGEREYLFSSAHSPTRLSDGRIAIGDMGSSELRYYDAAGRFLMRRGRKGQGPGEWSQLYRMRRGGGDSIQVIAPVSIHSIFSPEGEYVRRFSLEPVRNRPNIWALGRLANGAMLAYSLAPAGDRIMGQGRGEEATLGRDTTTRPATFYREMYQHFLYTAEGKVIDSIGILPGRGEHGGEREARFQPQGYYVVRGDSLFFGVGDAYEVRVYALWIADSMTSAPSAARALADTSPRPRAGMTLHRIIRRDAGRSLAITEEIIAADQARERVELEKLAKEFGGRFPIQLNLDRLAYPPTLPAHGRMLMDHTGHLWLQEYVMPEAADDSTRWSVFDEQGRWLGMFALPPRFAVSEIGRDYVLGMWRDELDVQRLRMYGLTGR